MNTTLRGTKIAQVTALIALALLVSACSKSEKTATQVAARVNGSEISVHQINFVLQRSNVKPEQAKAASEQILTRLVDQELAVQKATDRKLDRNPEVVQQLEAAKREILQRAYLESIAAAAAKPADKEIDDYYAAHPELFSARRVYTYRVLGIQAPKDKVAVIQELLARNRPLEEIAQWAKGENLRMVADGGTKAAEQMPMQSLPRLAQMKDGQIALATGPSGAELVHLIQSRAEPINAAQAKPVIERFISAQRRNELVQKEMNTLRDAGKIEFKGDFTHLAAALQSAPVAAPESASAAAPSAADAELAKGLAAGAK